MASNIEFKVKCPDCGKTVPFPSDMRASQLLICDHCEAHLGTAAEIRKAAKNQVVETTADVLRAAVAKAVKGKRHIKTK